ncbi:MAG: RdgB/HAM1 family non-canonical purine NTP pyrophosphatase [Clostridiales bacterium]|nr:RdgB/HAM1 family non-canonical purine NTP pyrophosphatase [Clostridiales bacterium]
MSEKQRIVVASGNRHKVKEIAQMLPEYEVVSYKDLGYDFEVEENGKTFYDNALIKAKTVALALNLPALSDDSGICATALNGEPGIYSARYAGDGDDEHNNDLLLKNLLDKEDRRAKYVCCLVFYKPNGEIITATGETHGKILKERVGYNGFGYDPIFFSDDLGKSMGLATDEEKNSVSHRFRALKKLREKLK